jgi:hypothetical protein
MKVTEEGTNLSLIGQFYVVFFQCFWLQAELLSHQNMMMITNTFGKVRQIKTSQLGRMNQVIILSMKQRLLSI